MCEGIDYYRGVLESSPFFIYVEGIFTVFVSAGLSCYRIYYLDDLEDYSGDEIRGIFIWFYYWVCMIKA